MRDGIHENDKTVRMALVQLGCLDNIKVSSLRWLQVFGASNWERKEGHLEAKMMESTSKKLRATRESTAASQ